MEFIALLICINTKDDSQQAKLIQLANLMLARFMFDFILVHHSSSDISEWHVRSLSLRCALR